MKSILYILITMVISAGSCIAQKTVKLKINHKQGTSAFVINQSSKNSLDEDYNANRLEYYMSELTLEHDNGIITEIDSFWILVDVKGASTFDLGQFNITKLEAIHFSIGVEQSFNHLDPSQWMSGHPLAPRSPSMHWGWTAGYRFFAMEGKCGSSLNNTYEFHSLGDNYYFDQRIETSGVDDNGDLLITLNANYDRVLDDVELGTGKVEHGEFPLNVLTLQNIRDYVFTSLEGNGNSLSTVGILENVSTSEISIYPNPSMDGKINIDGGDVDLSQTVIAVYDQTGRLVYQEQNKNWNGIKSIEIVNPGWKFR